MSLISSLLRMFEALSTRKNELKCTSLKEIYCLFILKADYFELNIHKIKDENKL